MKLYVGTYRKYNEGNLRGKWLDLDKFRSVEDFYAACRRIHKDEPDPELMFQDVEYVPGRDWERGMYSEGSIPEDYWTIKAEEDRKAKAARKVAKVIDPTREKFRAALAKVYEGDEKMQKFCDKEAEVVVELTGGELVDIDRPEIETRHCEGEDDGRGRSLADAEAGCRYFETEYGFKRTNLRAFDQLMVRSVGRHPRPEYGGEQKLRVCARYWRSQDCGICSCRNVMAGDSRDMIQRDANAEDARRVRHGWMLVRASFKKRLDSYWKRYGNSKLHTWTFWTEA